MEYYAYFLLTVVVGILLYMPYFAYNNRPDIK